MEQARTGKSARGKTAPRGGKAHAARRPPRVKSATPGGGGGAAATALRYCEDVLGGRIVACKWVKLAAQRHIDDLRDGHQRGLVFDPAAAQHAVEFFFALRHVKGDLAGHRIALEPWQVFILVSLFGWYRTDGSRRYRVAYLEVARKNAKSTLMAGIALYLAGSDGEPGAEVYTAATTFAQAAIVFKVAKQMVAKSKALRQHWRGWAQSLEHAASGSLLAPIHSKAESQEGLNVHGAVIDEFHAHDTDELYEVLRQGKGARRQPLIAAITTAGSNRAGPCYEQRDYTRKVLLGTLVDDSHFGIIYTLDEKDGDKPADDWRDPANWIKANPNLGISVNPAEMAEECKRAIASTRAQAHFRTKRCNVWVGAMEAYFDLAEWELCARPGMKPEDIEGADLYVALDLAAERDLVARANIFRKQLDTTHTEVREVLPAGEDASTADPVKETVEVHDVVYYLFVHFYLPDYELENPQNENVDAYRGWVEDGWITATRGTGTDFAVVKRDVLADRDKYPLREVGFDEWQAHQLGGELEAEGLTAVKIPQNVKQLSSPMKGLNRLVGDTARPVGPGNRIYHDGNPVMRWMMGNVVAKLDAKDNVFPRKEFPQNKIDGPVAAIMGFSRAMLGEGSTVLTADSLSVF